MELSLQPTAISDPNEFFWMGCSRRNACLPLSADAQKALFGSPAPPPPLHDHSLCPALIFDNKPRSNLSFVRRRTKRRMCALWDLNSDGGSAGSKEGKYKTLGERRFRQSAGMLFSPERLFPLCCWVGEPHACTSVSHSLSRGVITELC